MVLTFKPNNAEGSVPTAWSLSCLTGHSPLVLYTALVVDCIDL